MLAIILLGANFSETTRADFADGWEYHEYTAGSWAEGGLGVNLYAHVGDEDGRVGFIGNDWDLDDDGSPEAIGSGTSGLQGAINWGPTFAASTSLDFDLHSAIADFDNDGLEDLLSDGYFFQGRVYYNQGGRVFTPGAAWGVPSYDAGNIGDFNNDGFIDVVGGYSSSNIRWGPGFTTSQTLSIASGRDFAVGDFDKDGNVDIAQETNSAIQLYYGPAFGPGPTYANGTQWGMETADLNGDGWLDLVVDYTATAQIFWGGGAGFTAGPSTTSKGIRLGIADMDNDGNIDIVGCYTGGYIHYGPAFFTSNFLIPAAGGYGVQIADYDGDGSKDIASSNAVIWGPGYATTTPIAPGHSQDGLDRDLGDIYSRVNYTRYGSSVFDNAEPCSSGTVNWGTLEHNPSDTVTLWVRSGSVPVPDLSWTAWATVTGGRIPAGVDKWDYAGTLPGAAAGNRYLQYGANLVTDYTRTPYLRWVDISCSPTAVGVGEGTDIPGSTTLKPFTTKSGLVFQVWSPAVGDALLSLYDGAGRLVLKRSLTLAQGENRVELSISSGVYLYVLTAEDGRLTGRAAVVR